MDAVVLSGLALLTVVLGTMVGLIHAELRDRRRSLHRRTPHQPRARAYTHTYRAGPRATGGSARPRGAHGAYRPAPAAQCADPWAPFVVRHDTGPDDIKRQYRTLARRYHPDHGGDARAMARINGLYADLLRQRT